MAYPESLCLQGTRPLTYPWESLGHGLFSRYFWRNNPTIMPNTEEGKVEWIFVAVLTRQWNREKFVRTLA
jgi:hypothetical protein